MADFYVHDSGTWSEAPGTVYTTVYNAINTGGAGGGDTILVSDDHDTGDLGASTTWAGGTTTTLQIICVTHADATVRSTGAVEKNTTGNYNFIINGNVYMYGMVITNTGYFYMGTTGRPLFFDECTITIVSGAGYYFRPSSNVCRFLNCDFVFNANASAKFNFDNATTLYLYGGTLSKTTTDPSFLFATGSYSTRKSLCAVDISGFTSTSTEVSGALTYNYGEPNLIADRCKKHANVDWYETSLTLQDYLEIYGGTEHVDEHYGHQISCTEYDLTGDDSVVRNAGAHDGVTAYSKLISPNVETPSIVHLADLFIDITSNKTLTVELAQYNAGGAPTALTDAEFSIFAISPDTTNEAEGVLTKGGSLSTSTVRWDDSGGTEISSNITKQKVSVTISGAAGVEGQVTVYMVTNPSSTQDINVCPLIDVA